MRHVTINNGNLYLRHFIQPTRQRLNNSDARGMFLAKGLRRLSNNLVLRRGNLNVHEERNA